LWAKLMSIPTPYLYGGIVTLAMVGAYVLNNNPFDLWAAVAIGIIGLLFRKFGYPVTPLILGVILGPMSEQQFRRALQGSAGDPGILVSTPFTISVYILLTVVLVGPPVYRALKRKQESK
jgi:putative tricarboxylic transport membrane protein